MDSKFQLKLAINNFIASISTKGTITIDDEQDLTNHLFDTVESLTAKGLSEQEAFEVAKLRMGNTNQLVLEYQKVNGTNMLNKEWVFIFIGIAFTMLIINYIQATSIGIGYYYSLGEISLNLASFLLSISYLIIAIVAILLFKNGNSLSAYFREKIFDKNPGIISIISTCIGLLYLIPLGKVWGTNAYKKYEAVQNEIVYNNLIAETIIRGTIPTILILSIFLATQSVNKKISLQSVLNTNNYLYIFMLGLGLETIAALLSRMTFGISWYSPIIFGITYFIGIMLFLKYNLPYSNLKFLVFISFTLFFETFFGYFNSNLSENMSTIQSPFAWVVLSAICIGIIGNKLIPQLNR